MEVNDTVIKDVAEGSSALKEVVNLAYVLTVMARLKMTSHPLYLDEFGKSFDSTHRINAYEYIKEFLSQTNYSNIFIVSHYPELYTIFSDHNTEYTILDSRNIDTSDITAKINTTMTYI